MNAQFYYSRLKCISSVPYCSMINWVEKRVYSLILFTTVKNFIEDKIKDRRQRNYTNESKDLNIHLYMYMYKRLKIRLRIIQFYMELLFSLEV